MLPSRHTHFNTGLGLISILLWSSIVPVGRVLTEDLGIFGAAFWMYFGSGILTCVLAAMQPGKLQGMWRLPRKYLLLCGGLFVVNLTLFHYALGSASDRQQAVIVGMLNYLWPAYTLALSVPILGKRARWTLLPGMLLAIGGISIAVTQNAGSDMNQLTSTLKANWVPYVCATLGATCWGLFTNFSTKLTNTSGAMPLFLLATGLVMGLFCLNQPFEAHWRPQTFAALAYITVLPVSMGYILWERAARHGNFILLSTIAYFIPLCSIIICALYFQIHIQAGVWMGCGLVILGALLCQKSFKAHPSPA